MIAGAGAFAAAELAVTLLVGRFFEWGRTENLLFLAFRPWLILAAALLIARWDWRARTLFYPLALLAAAASHAAFLAALGADRPFAGAGQGLLAGLLLAAIVDPVIGMGRERWGRRGQSVAAAAIVLLFVLPFGLLRIHEAIALGRGPALPASAEAPRPVLHLMTALPLVWGEAGAFGPDSRPTETYRQLDRAFDIRLLDSLGAEALAEARLLLLAQPRALAPEELVALDAWVRGGGRALILTDPALVWPSELPLGDVRRPPPVGLLGGLLGHWGLALDSPERARLVVDHFASGGAVRRIGLAAPGAFRAEGGACAVAGRPWLARCRPGAGEALLVADADLLDDRLWVGPAGAGRNERAADNPLILVEWLDRLAGVVRSTSPAEVQWLRPEASRGAAIAAGLAPAAFALLAGLGLGRLRRRRG
ncbi:MAG: hypothetical protein ACK4K7_05615 [Allosphingosinicella sp.]|uniref:Gldg family protein n=1 Tax=Allosphingosinicella sp. TaxID=2823234 RepID=UPI00392E8035